MNRDSKRPTHQVLRSTADHTGARRPPHRKGIPLLISAALVSIGLCGMLASVRRILSTRSVEGYAIPTAVMSLCNALSWIVYALTSHTAAGYTLIGTSSVNATLFATVLAMAHRTGVFPIRKSLAIVSCHATIMGAAVAVFGFHALMAIVPVTTFAILVPQLIKAITTPGGRGISIVGSGAQSTQRGLSLAVALSAHDLLFVATSSFSSATWLFVTIRALVARFDEAKLRPAPQPA